VTDDQNKPNGLCFSPDYKLLYVVDSGQGKTRGISVYDVADQAKLKNGRLFTNMELGNMKGGSDGRARRRGRQHLVERRLGG